MATGDLTQFGARRAFPVWNYYLVDADETPDGLNGSCVVSCIYCITAGTIDGVYDAAGAAVGTNLAPAVALTARQRIDFANGTGTKFMAGVYVAITGGTYLVLAAPGA
jgi:hypothetical protein